MLPAPTPRAHLDTRTSHTGLRVRHPLLLRQRVAGLPRLRKDGAPLPWLGLGLGLGLGSGSGLGLGLGLGLALSRLTQTEQLQVRLTVRLRVRVRVRLTRTLTLALTLTLTRTLSLPLTQVGVVETVGKLGLAFGLGRLRRDWYDYDLTRTRT